MPETKKVTVAGDRKYMPNMVSYRIFLGRKGWVGGGGGGRGEGELCMNLDEPLVVAA